MSRRDFSDIIQERMYQGLQSRSFREDQQQIQRYYNTNMRTINRMKIEVILCIVIIILAVSLQFVTGKMVCRFGLLPLRLLFWLHILSILGIVFLVILQVTHCGMIYSLIRSSWNQLISRQRRFIELYVLNSQRLIVEHNATITSRSVRTLLQAIGRDMTSLESRRKYVNIDSEERCLQNDNLDDQIRYLDLNVEHFLVETDDSRRLNFSTDVLEGNIGFDAFINALAEISKCGRDTVVGESHRMLVDRYTDELIQKIHEHVNGDWLEMRDTNTFYDFIKINWNHWFPPQSNPSDHVTHLS